MKTVWAMVGVFALCILTPPPDALARCWYGEAPCVRFKAGQQVRSDQKCWITRCDFYANWDDPSWERLYSSCFQDEQRDLFCKDNRGMAMTCTARSVMDDCYADVRYTLDGSPAAKQNRPVMGTGWQCYEKLGTDEVMCASEDENYPE